MSTLTNMYNDICITNMQVNYIIQEGYGGGMVWSLDLDDFRMLCGNRSYPLINTMKDLLEAAENS